MLSLILSFFITVSAFTGAFSGHQAQDPIACAYQGNNTIACVEGPDGYWFGTLDQAEDPSGEGYVAFWVNRSTDGRLVRWLVGDYRREVSEGSLWVGQPMQFWLVDLPEVQTLNP